MNVENAKSISSKLTNVLENEFEKWVNHYKVNPDITNQLTVKISNRLKTTGGRFKYFSQSKTTLIELNLKYLSRFGESEFIKIFRHELAHFIDWSQRRTTDHDIIFKKICLDIGGCMNPELATGDFAQCASINFIKPKYNWKYQCKCGLNNFQTVRKLTKTHQVCSRCGQTVKDMEMSLKSC